MIEAKPLDDATRTALAHDIAFALSGRIPAAKRKGGGWVDDSVERERLARSIVAHLETARWLFARQTAGPLHRAPDPTAGAQDGSDA